MPGKLRVAYLDHAEKMGGAEFSLFYLIKENAESGIQSLLVAPENSETLIKIKKDITIPAEIFSHPLTSLNPFKGIQNFFKLIKGILTLIHYFKMHVDVVHVNTYRAAVYGLIAGKIAGKKTVWHVRDIHRSLFFRKLMPLFADKIITVSKAAAAPFSAKLTRNKVEVIYNGVDLTEYASEKTPGTLKQELHLSKDEILIGMVGRINRWKGFHLFIQAMPMVINRHPHVKAVIVGEEMFSKEGYLEELKDLTSGLGLEKTVRFLGRRTDIPNVMKSLDILVNFSSAEPFGRVIIEALAMETPVIVAGSGGPPEIVGESKCGYVVEEPEPIKLAEAIVNMIDENDIESMGFAGRKLIEKQFNTKKVNEKVLSVYEYLQVKR